MKPVKAWEALKAWQEEGRKCRPVDVEPSYSFDPPDSWSNFLARVYVIEPPKPQVVEFEGIAEHKRFEDMDLNFYTAIAFDCSEQVAKELDGKRWRVTCTEIVDD